MKILLILSLLFLSACNTFGLTEQYDRTPEGWHVHWLEHGTLLSGAHTRLELYNMFDAAMIRSIAECSKKVNLPEDYIRKSIKERDALYTLYDDSIFPVAPGSADAPTAVWASGMTSGRSNTSIAFYLWVSVDPTQVPKNAHSWTIHPNPNHSDKMIYGADQPGNEYPALGYELHWQFTQTP